MMNSFLGGSLKKVSGHVRTEHEIEGQMVKSSSRKVNSYHGLAIETLAKGFSVQATAPDGEIEAIHHEELNWWGIMWHPERDAVLSREDYGLFGDLFLPNKTEVSTEGKS